MDGKIVLVLSATGANDAVRGQMEQYARALEESGTATIMVDVTEPAELSYAMSLVMERKVAYAFTWLGIAQDMTVNDASGATRNAWDAFRIPVVKLQGDLPAYFVSRHLDEPRASVNLYGPEEFVKFRRDWLPEARAIAAVVSPLPLDPMPESAVERRTRRLGKLFFIKNGNSPSELTSMWTERLRPSTARLLGELVEHALPIALRRGRFDIGDVVGRFLESRGIDPHSMRRKVLFAAAQLDDYLRRVKSRMIAKALLDLPVVVQGSLWHHLDFTGKAARLVEGSDYATTRTVYREALGIIDMSPNVDTSPHERAQRAAGSFALCLTNRQGWLEREFSDCVETMFEFTEEAISERVRDVIANPDRYLDLGEHFGRQFRERYPASRFAGEVTTLADLARLDTEEQPELQPFFQWP